MGNSNIQENQTARIKDCIFHKINSIFPLGGYKLVAHFWDGTTKIYDINPLFRRFPIFNRLKKNDLFNKVHVDIGGYGVVWNGDIDLACDEIWEHGTTVKTPFDDIISFSDASLIWGLNESTLRKAVSYGKFIKGVDVCKYGKQWLISLSAMCREYGIPQN